MKQLFNKKGQSTLEYVIIWTVIIAAILAGATRFLKPAINSAVEQASSKIGREVGKLTTDTER